MIVFFITGLMAMTCVLCALLFTGAIDIDSRVVIVAWIGILTVYGLYLKYTRKKLSMKAIIVLLFITGFILRLNYVMYTDAASDVRQHDVGHLFSSKWGHAAYIEMLFRKWFVLPEDPTKSQFYHPPLHHFLAAVWMHIFTQFFAFSAEQAASCVQYLTLFYSSCCMIVTERILNALDIRKTGKIIAFSIVAFHPTFIILAGSVNNDILSILLTLLAIYTTMRWYQNPSLKRIVLIALSIGLGMMTKLTVAVVAPSVALIFLIKLIQGWGKKQRLNYFGQYCVFGCICIPLGLWYPIWKHVCYDVPLNYVQKLPLDDYQYVGFHSVYERLLDFSYHPFQTPYTAWTYNYGYCEYNPFVSIVKTSVFGEYNWGMNETLLFLSRLLLCANILMIVLSIVAMVFVILKKNTTFNRTLKLFLVSYHVILFVYFIVFCIQYPHTCSMDYRYIVPTCVLGAVYIGFMYERISEINEKWHNATKIIRCFVACGTGIFCALSAAVYVIYGMYQ